ncbi:MAG: nitroreductase family protein, partial [Candidatus Helarchaeota archaeon]
MKIVGIDQEKCTKCGQCIKECQARVFFKGDDTIYFSDPDETCIRCGHCLAVCPANAIIAEDAELFEFEEARDPSQIIHYDYLLRMYRGRRSIRQFKQDEVSREKIEKILEAMRYAPSGSNLQNWNYIILTNPEKIKYLSDETVKLLYLAKKASKFRFILRFFVSGATKQALLDPKNVIRLERLIADYEAGNDVIFYNAPCVILLHAPKYGSIAGNDA